MAKRILVFIKKRFVVIGLSLTVLLLIFPPWVESKSGMYFEHSFLLSTGSYLSISFSLLTVEIIVIWLLLGIAYKLAPKDNNTKE